MQNGPQYSGDILEVNTKPTHPACPPISRSSLRTLSGPLDLSPKSGYLAGQGPTAFTDDHAGMRNVLAGDKVSSPGGGDGGGGGVYPSKLNGMVQSEAIPLDLSMHSKQRNGIFSSCANTVSSLDEHVKKLHNQRHLDFLQQQQQEQQPALPLTSGALHTSRDTVCTFSSGSNQYLRILLNQAAPRDDPASLTSASSSLLSTSVGSVSSGPAESYVIDLEPGRSSISESSTQEQRIYVPVQQKNPTKSYESFTPSKLFSSPLHPRIPEQAVKDSQTPTQNTLSSLTVQHCKKISVLDSSNFMLHKAEDHVISENLQSRHDVAESLEEKLRPLPSYSEALSSIILSKQHHIKQENFVSSSGEAARGHVASSQLFAPEHVTLLHSDQHMDVRFVPYSSLGKLSCPNTVDCNTRNQENHNMLSRNMFSLPREDLNSRVKLGVSQTPVKGDKDDTLSPRCDSPVSSSRLREDSPTSKLSFLPVSKSLHSHDIKRPACGENQGVTAIFGNALTPSNLSLSNVLFDSKPVVLASASGADGKPVDTLTSEEIPIVSDTGSVTLTGVPTAYIMAQAGTGEDGLNSVLAIPVIHGGNLPSAFTGLQPIAFAPHSVAPATLLKDSLYSVASTLKQQNREDGQSDGQLPQASLEEKLTSQNNRPSFRKGNNEFLLTEEYDQIERFGENLSSNEANTENSVDNCIKSVALTQISDTKSKAGRPRGRGGRGGGKGVASKEMKLLTENTLFPGVYTSILKLPWSRRTRNKAKAKTVSQMRKEAQAIAVAKEKQKSSQLTVLGDNISPTDYRSDMKSGFLNGNISSCGNNKDLSNISTTVPNLCPDFHERDNSETQENCFLQKKDQETEIKESSDGIKIHFPHLDEVLRQSYALQRSLQKKDNISAEPLETSSKSSLSLDLCNLNGCKSQLFQNTNISSLSGLTSSQFQRALETSPLVPLMTSTLHSTDSDRVLNSPSHSEEASNQLPVDNPSQRDFSTSSASSQSAMFDLFVSSPQTCEIPRESEKQNGEKKRGVASPESKSPSTHRRRGRPPKPSGFTPPLSDIIDSNVPEDPSDMIASPATATRQTSSRASLTGGVCIIPNFASTNLEVTHAPRNQRTINDDQTEEMTLEKKISLLTQQIGVEMSQSLRGVKNFQQTELCDATSAQTSAKIMGEENKVKEKYLPGMDQNNLRLNPAVSELMNRPGCDSRFQFMESLNDVHLRHSTNNTIEHSTNVSGSNTWALNRTIFPKRVASETSVPSSDTSPHSQLSLATAITETHLTPAPRRKKVSRLLKSDENFMYATFKIKPKGGLTPRKPRRKRKGSDVMRDRSVGTAVKKKLQVNLDSGAEVMTVEPTLRSSILWKFHEQFTPTPGVDGTHDEWLQNPVTSEHSTAVMSAACDICGTNSNNQPSFLAGLKTCRKCYPYNDKADHHKKETTVANIQLNVSNLQNSDQDYITPAIHRKSPSIISNHHQFPVSELSASSNVDSRYLTTDLRDSGIPVRIEPASSSSQPDMLSASCMTCGQTFHKFYSDPRGSCDSCLSVAPRVISSSKLFSLIDSPSESSTVSASQSFSSPLVSPVTTADVSLSSSTLSFPAAPSVIMAPTSSSSTPHIFSLSSLQPCSTDLEHSSMITAPTNTLADISCTEPGTLFFSPTSNAMILLADNSGRADSIRSLPVASVANVLTSPMVRDQKVSRLSSSSLSLSSVPFSPISSPAVCRPGGDLLSSKPTPGREANKRIQSAKVSGNNLYCSICRMKFAKICDYLSHVRQVHDKDKAVSRPGILYSFKASKYNTDSFSSPKKPSKRPTRVSKTKKSLAHKTLTCPVEDCPHFFREEKEIGGHFLRKHPDLLLCPYHDCTYTCRTREDLQSHISVEHDASNICDSSDTTDQSSAGVSANGRASLTGPADVREIRTGLNTAGLSEDPSGQKFETSSEAAEMNCSGLSDESEKPVEQTQDEMDQHLNPKLSLDLIDAPGESDIASNHVTAPSQSASEKPLQCEFCDYRCRQKNALSWHMRKHPEAAGQYRKYNTISEK